MKKILFLIALFPILVLGQSTNQNYTKAVTYKQPTSAQETSTDIDKVAVQVVYYDGLGRPIEQIVHKQSVTGKDIVTPIEYDAFGRQTKEYLPIVIGESLDFHSITPIDVLSYYSDGSIPTMETTNTPFNEKELENSPLGRIYKQAAPGDAWAMGNGHEIKFDYQTNQANEVKLYKAIATWDVTSGIYTTDLVDAYGKIYYQPNQLYKTITKDENWVSGNDNTTEEFKDKAGKVVLKKTYNEDESYETYYVYDPFGNLTYVIPPIVNTSDGISPSVLDNLCYQYKYDSRNRLVEKRLPGKQWEFIVYNNQNMPVASGPAFSPFGGGSEGWLITKYDAFGRVIYTGWYNGIPSTAVGRKTYQDTQTSGWAENYVDFDATLIDGVFVNYTNKVFPDHNEDYKLLTINFYDGYIYNGIPTIPTNILDQDVSIIIKGLPTGSWVRVITTPSEIMAEISYSLYDKKNRVISNYKQNYLGGYTIVNSKFDFIGKTNYTITQHKRDSNSPEILVRNDFEYTPQDRLLINKQNVNEQGEELIVKNDYDDLGQLITKNVGGADISSYIGLQKVDYRYTIRGWLKSINDVTELTKPNEPTDLFAFKINYDDQTSYEFEEHTNPLYNGNISETYWRTNTDNVLRKYGYQYDALNRLTNAIYQKPNNTISTTNMYNENLTYDKNGNITHLNRNGDFDADAASGVLQIDDLNYSYHTNRKNQLMKVTDGSNNPKGFKDDSDGINDVIDDYKYDYNGNMEKDDNKNISKIVYNHLNLPTQINFGTGNKIEYLYNAVGQKVEKKVFYGSSSVITDYLDGYQYTNSVLNFFPHAEGYVNAIGNQTGYKFFYVYNYTDHLGNIRASYGKDPYTSVLKILEENHYYPFGLKHSNYSNGKRKFAKEEEINESEEYLIKQRLAGEYIEYKYKYQGQERQDELGLNWDSFKWRNYDYAIGRFMSIDPLAEKYAYNSPYAFQENKMGMGRELEGLEMMPWDVVRLYAASKIASFQVSTRNTLNSALGNNGQASLSGNKTNVNVAGINVEKVKDLAEVSKQVHNNEIKVARATANTLEKAGDKTTIVSAGAAQPEGVLAGEVMSTTGKLMNSAIDLAEGKPAGGVATDLGISLAIGVAGDKIIGKAVDNGVVKEQAQVIVKTVEMKVEEIIEPKK